MAQIKYSPPLIENLLLVPRTGTGVRPPILRLDSTSSSSNFLRLMERVELIHNANLSLSFEKKFYMIHVLANLRR